jgi:hypothetical protein
MSQLLNNTSVAEKSPPPENERAPGSLVRFLDLALSWAQIVHVMRHVSQGGLANMHTMTRGIEWNNEDIAGLSAARLG